MNLLRQLVASAMLVVLSVPLLCGCAKPMPRMPDAESVGLRQMWMRQIPLASGEKIVHVWRVGDSLYATTSEAHIACLSAASGTLSWMADLENSQYQIYRPALIPGSKDVLVVNRGVGFLIDKQTGEVMKKNRLSVAVTTDPIVAGNLFCVGGVNFYRAMFVDVLQGQRWVTPAPNDVFTARPAVEGDTVLLATEAGKLWRISLVNGDWIWRDRQTNGSVVGGLAADGHAVYVPCLDKNVYAFDMTSGAFLWNKPLEGRLDRALLVTRNLLLTPSTGEGLYALSTSRGDVKWEAKGVTEIGTVVRDRVWVSDTKGNLKALSLDTGEVLMTLPANAAVVTNEEDQLVIMVNNEGVLTAYAPMK